MTAHQTNSSTSRAWARDIPGALALVEGAVAQRVFTSIEGLALPSRNVFGESLSVEQATDTRTLVKRCAEAAAGGERVALIARAGDLPSARTELAHLAAQRLGVVVHTLARSLEPGQSASEGGIAPALALDDLAWGMLFGAGVADALDLALVARRAAEDSGCPFFVVHESPHAHHVEPVAAPSRELCEAFLGPSTARVRGPGASSPVRESDRAVAQRLPFALGSALRELENMTGRHHEVIERAPLGDTPIALVGVGAVGDSLVADIERLRASGHDVSAVRIVAWRPFPAARLVKALSRTLAVTVLESVDQPLAGNPPLAAQLKAAFADALTWAPDYPGVGRIPRIVSGVLAPHRDVDSSDLDAIVANLLADERGKRTFLLGGDEVSSLPSPPVERGAANLFAMRGITSRHDVATAAGELCATVLVSALGVRARVAVRQLPAEEGGGVAFDLVAARERPRGAHAPHALRVVAVDEVGALSRGNPLARLAPGGLFALPTAQRAADALWAEVPPWAKAIAFDRGARVVGWSPAGRDEDRWAAAAAFVGIALAVAIEDRSLAQATPPSGRQPIDGAVVEREVAEALRVALHGKHLDGAAAAGVIERGSRIARVAFETHVEVPRATIQREDDGVRLGRRDSRVAARMS
jgi:pyruvate-ferredoxin/flavodoxin oxidoreductase